MKKILINYLGKSNSGPLIALGMAKGLVVCGYEVYAILSSSISNKQDWIEMNGFKDIYFVDTYNSKGEFILSTVKFLLLEKRKISKYFRNIQFDYVINPMHHLWSTGIIKLFKKSTVISVCHDPIPHEGESKLESSLTKILMVQSDYIIVLTKKFISVVCDRFGKKEEQVIYMPHGRLDYYKKIQKADNKVIEKKNYLFFGRIEVYKGLDILIKAYKKLKKNYENVQLTIAGKGDMSEYSKLLEGLKDVHISNCYIPDEEVGNYFDNENTIVVLPYISASQSGVIPIALEYENVVIASDTGGLKEQLNDGEIGIMFESGSVDDLYAKMLMTYENTEFLCAERKKMTEMRAKLSWDIVVKVVMDSIEAKELGGGFNE